MPDYPHIQQYYQDKQRLIEYGGSDNEQSIRAAFQTCLAAYCRAHRENLELVPELSTIRGVRPDGTVKDSMRLTHGYWEAKDLHDNLDAEIQKKFESGYPDDNIIFENSRIAVLVQRGTVAMRVDMRQPTQLHRLIQAFLNFVTGEVEEFRQAWIQFKKDLPGILVTLREAVGNAAESDHYRAAADGFLELCHRTIGPAVSEFDVQEMLIQHILTRDIFLRVFNEEQFHQENNIARQLDALAQTFFTGSLRRETVGELLPYYGAITAAAANIGDYREKQRFLKVVYEDFYQVYNPAAADYLGVVYTPDAVVDFIIRGADYLLQKYFGRRLADDNVQILDPATGTGTFITGLIDYLPPERLKYKYLNEIHANEVAILPYYIANLNIEYSYKERTGGFLDFPNLCFVDTLDNMGWQGAGEGVITRQPAFNLGAISEENWIRLQEQNERPISVIIGNPPYNANQQNENDNNKNREYPDIDRRISETYIAASTAQKTKQYDMYKRFIRWASDRLSGDGIIAFISNSSFLDSHQDDGFRRIVADEFNELWAIDLKGNARTSGERRRQEGGNIFDNKIRVGVAIYFLVRRQDPAWFTVFYNAVDDYAKAPAKIEYIQGKTLDDFEFSEFIPGTNGLWIHQPNGDFANLMPLANRETKLAKSVSEEQAVFGLYSMGVATNRDEWVYDFDESHLSRKVRALIDSYEQTRGEYGGKEFYDSHLGTEIKWTRDLKRQLSLNLPNQFKKTNIRGTMFRPYVHKYLYFSQNLNEMQYQLPSVFPGVSSDENIAICFCVNGKDFYALATNKICDLHFTGDTQCLPLYRYTADGQRVSNITDWGLRQFREHYHNDGITPEDIFAYTYAALHDPAYREVFQKDLLREFPRLPLQHNFRQWAQWGRELLEWHLGFESTDPWPLERVEQSGAAGRPILRADKKRGVITLDQKTTLTGIPVEVWEYRLGSRSALEWVLEQYKERIPRDPTIRERFNNYRFADHKEKVIDLLRRVCTVSYKTVYLTNLLDSFTYFDPDEGLTLRPEFIAEMQERMASNEPTIPAEEVYRRLGLE